MGIYDRDYVRKPGRGGGSAGGGPRIGGLSAWSANTWLIVVNIAVFVIEGFLPQLVNTQTGVTGSILRQYGHFSTYAGFQRLEVWRLVSFQFLHFDIWHLVMNMFGLWIFGSMVEQYLGKKRYVAFYLVSGIFGGLLYLVLNVFGVLGVPLPGTLAVETYTPLIGASAGVFGVIMACAYLAPNMVIQLLIPPIPLRMKWFAYGYVGIAVFVLLTGGHNAGGQAAHLGGAMAGAFFIRYPRLLIDFFDVFEDSRKKQPRPGRMGGDAAKIDRILDKVSREGLESLSAKEKRLLSQETKNRRQA